jgi:hypothetical protein
MPSRKLSQAEAKAAADWATDQLAALTTKGKGERSKAPACPTRSPTRDLANDQAPVDKQGPGHLGESHPCQ